MIMVFDGFRCTASILRLLYFNNMIDQILINLTSLLVSGTGIFVVFTKFNVPELRASYLGQNPYMIKAEQIGYVTTWVFTILAIIGLLFQAAKEILGDSIPDQLHSTQYYSIYFFVGLFLMICIVWILSKLCNLIARPIWLPKVIESQRESFDIAVSIIENDGWRKDQLAEKDSIKESEKHRIANFKTVQKNLSQIEKLLDLPQKESDFSNRIKLIKLYFKSAK